MNALFAVSLFDNPWMVAVVIIVGALVNWLSKRREEKQAGPPPEGEEPSPSAGKPPGALTLEETLRRLMGEEPPAPMPAPPPIPDAARGGSPPAPDWEKEEPFEPVRQTVPPSRPPLPAVAQASVSAIATTVREQAEAARRFEQFNEQGRHPATVVGHGRGYRSHAGKRAAVRWRDPRSARQGFVASLVFGPPKSLEP